MSPGLPIPDGELDHCMLPCNTNWNQLRHRHAFMVYAFCEVDAHNVTFPTLVF